MLRSYMELRDLPLYCDFHDLRKGKPTAGLEVEGAKLVSFGAGLRLRPSDEPVELSIPVGERRPGTCRLLVNLRNRGKVEGSVVWLDAGGRAIGEEPAGHFSRVGRRMFSTLEMDLEGGSDESVARLAIRLESLDHPLDLQWIQLVRDVTLSGTSLRLGRRHLVTKVVDLGDELRWDVEVPESGQLVLSTGFKVKRGFVAEGMAEFVVEAVDREGNILTELLRHRIDMKRERTRPEWAGHLVSLEKLEGRTVTLVLRVEPVGTVGPNAGGLFLWGDPVIVRGRGQDHLNVVLMILDAFRRDRVGAYGNELGLTPSIDRLAEEGVLYEKALAPATWTLPSVSSLFTSLYPPTHGAGSDTPLEVPEGKDHSPPYALTEDVVTLAEILKADHYRTACFHNNPFFTKAFGLDQGFDVERADRGPRSLNHALSFLRNNLGEKTFVLLHFIEPHLPYKPPAPFKQRFAEQRPAGGAKDEKRAWKEGLYNGDVAYTDDMVGDFLEGLDGLGLRENTLVILTADHGEELWDHVDIEKEHYTERDWWEHGTGHGISVYQEVAAVPLLMRLPGRIEAGARSQERANLVDLAPTVLDWLDLPIPEHFVGRSLRPGSPNHVERDFDFTMTVGRGGHDRWAYYEGPWKLIVSPFSGFEELYRLENDPGERRNVADENPEVLESLRDKLESLLEAALRENEELAIGDPPLPEITREAHSALKALGYVD
jgi:arylsulfatase A-like enzyme